MCIIADLRKWRRKATVYQESILALYNLLNASIFMENNPKSFNEKVHNSVYVSTALFPNILTGAYLCNGPMCHLKNRILNFNEPASYPRLDY